MFSALRLLIARARRSPAMSSWRVSPRLGDWQHLSSTLLLRSDALRAFLEQETPTFGGHCCEGGNGPRKE